MSGGFSQVAFTSIKSKVRVSSPAIHFPYSSLMLFTHTLLKIAFPQSGVPLLNHKHMLIFADAPNDL